jgi:putative spermidine/putrescine transport system substrate-binding protein
LLLYNTAKEKKPTSWATLYDSKNKGKITIPDNPIQIADAALYLSKTKPALGITDPFELTKPQLAAAVALLKQQRPLVKKYWGLASDQIDLFKNGGSTLGASWPYQYSQLLAAKAKVGTVIPKEGVTGWLDTWMLSSKAKHPNCAYKWMQYITTAKPQAQQAVYYGETPVNKKACKIMDTLSKGSCDQYFANAPESYYRSIKFWKTPVADCGNGKTNCTDLKAWTTAWQQIKG